MSMFAGYAALQFKIAFWYVFRLDDMALNLTVDARLITCQDAIVGIVTVRQKAQVGFNLNSRLVGYSFTVLA